MSKKVTSRKALRPKMVSENISRREFTYTIGGTRLSFTLRTDIETELLDFKTMMVAAAKDIDGALKNIKK